MKTIKVIGKGICVEIQLGNGVVEGINLSRADLSDYNAEIDQTGIAGQFHEYLKGVRKDFDLNLNQSNLTPFQTRVFKALARTHYGETISYEDLAIKIGGANYRRAVAQALSANPFPIVIPCHRVVPKHFQAGRIGGFSCGVDIKEKLLKIEGVL